MQGQGVTARCVTARCVKDHYQSANDEDNKSTSQNRRRKHDAT